jgi:hypothetical protein
VLRPFPDEVGIFVGPNKVLLVRARRGWRPKTLAERAITVDATESSDWSLALDALRRELEQPTWRDARARVVVSNHWAHYDVLPWSVELAKESERREHARYLLAATYGDVVDDWTVALSRAAPGAARLVCGLPRNLLDDLDDAITAHGLKLVSVQPHLVAAYNLSRHRMPRSSAWWFTTIDERSLVAMHLSEGHCDRVRAVRISDDWGLELQRIQTLGRLAQDRPAEGPIFVDAPQGLRNMAGARRASVEWLEHDGAASGTIARLAAFREAQA